MVKIKILRHAQRLDYTQPWYWLMYFGSYWADTPLTDYGHQTAREKGKKLANDDFHPKHIYVSPYTRTINTGAEIMKSFHQCQMIIEPLLSEYQPRSAHCINAYPYGIPTTYNSNETEFQYPEEYTDFEKRVEFIVDRLIESNSSDIMIVSHGEFIRVSMKYLSKKFPDLILDSHAIPYLTTLTFEYHPDTKQIDENSIKIEF